MRTNVIIVIDGKGGYQMVIGTEYKDKIDIACNNYKKIRDSKHRKFKKLDAWLEKESEIFKAEANNKQKLFKRYKRGQIIKIDFGINIGSELSHTHFGIVINKDDTVKNDNITVVPISSKKGYKRLPLNKILLNMYSINSKYNLNCYALITQITTISKTRILENNKKYVCENEILELIDKAIIENFTNHKLTI